MEDILRRRTILLTERRPADCRLSTADVAFLLAEHRGHIELLPTGRRGHYRLTSLGHVGTIIGPGCRLLIRPKVPLANLYYMLDPTAPIAIVEDDITAVPREPALDFLAGRLAQLLTERAAAGLHRDYAERAEHGPFLQGKLDVPAQLRSAPAHREQLHCRYEEFTADVPCNQVPKATAERLLRSALLSEASRAALQRALQGFTGVSAPPLGPDSFAAVLPDRRTSAYRPLLDLCRVLVEGLAASAADGSTCYPSFLLDLDRVFENYCVGGCEAGFASEWAQQRGYRAVVQPLFQVDVPVDGQPELTMRPDLLLEKNGRPVLVLDAKWKRLAGSPLVTSDVYQVLAYCTALGVRRAVLVYPGGGDRAWTYQLARAPVEVTIRTLRVSGTQAACAQSMRKLLRILHGFCHR